MSNPNGTQLRANFTKHPTKRATLVMTGRLGSVELTYSKNWNKNRKSEWLNDLVLSEYAHLMGEWPSGEYTVRWDLKLHDDGTPKSIVCTIKEWKP